MSTSSTYSKKKGRKHALRLRATEDFISAYVNLVGEDGRKYIEGCLARQVYGDAGMYHYLPGSNCLGVKISNETNLCECMLEKVHEPWSKWAAIIKKATLYEPERGEAAREMLCVLIQHKSRSSCLNDSELRESAESALEWTRWDEFNNARTRSRKSPAYKSCMEALAGKDCEESFQKFKVGLQQLEVIDSKNIRPQIGVPATEEL
jgi:hypothetical protein